MKAMSPAEIKHLEDLNQMELLIKSKKFPEGTIRTWGKRHYIKRNGKWIPYTEKGKASQGHAAYGGKAPKPGENVEAMTIEKKEKPSAWAEYERVMAQAWAEHKRVMAQADAEYERMIAPAWAEYQRVMAQADAEYERVEAAEYKRVIAPAKEVQRVTGTRTKGSVSIGKGDSKKKVKIGSEADYKGAKVKIVGVDHTGAVVVEHESGSRGRALPSELSSSSKKVTNEQLENLLYKYVYGGDRDNKYHDQYNKIHDQVVDEYGEPEEEGGEEGNAEEDINREADRRWKDWMKREIAAGRAEIK